ncbi:MAG TPA: universal stress protein [Acidimicrobiales bacterium]|nr:universal stress protein [Acidimicrobiales bacterium]
MSRTIVGIDGSENSARALAWAVERAERSGDEVVAVLAWSFFDQGYRPAGEAMQPEFTDVDAQRVLAKAIDSSDLAPRVTQRCIQGPAAEVITEFADAGDTIVVGARGLGGFEGLLLGSVSQRILELAPCPVAVIHVDDATPHRNTIVVGVDGSDVSMRALRWAAAEASSLGASVRLVHAWQWPLFAEVAVPEVYDALAKGADELLAEVSGDPSLAGLTVEVEAVNGGPAQSLLANGADAAMIVIADRGRGPLRRTLLGSTSRQVAQHATTPVVVVRGEA